jgi:hypothetical protein
LLPRQSVTFSVTVPNLSLKSFALPCGRLWYGESNAISNAIGYAEHYSRSHEAVIRVYDPAGNLIETQEHRAILRSGEVSIVAVVAGATVDWGNPSPVTIIMVVVVIPVVVAVVAVSVVTPMIVIGRRPSR